MYQSVRSAHSLRPATWNVFVATPLIHVDYRCQPTTCSWFRRRRSLIRCQITEYRHWRAETNIISVNCFLCARYTTVLVIWRRNRFQGTGSKVPKPVPKPGTRNRFFNIVSLTHCIICALYESLFVNNESRNIDLKLMRLCFHFFIHSFRPIRCMY